MYRIEFTNPAAKEFRALSEELKRRIVPVVDGLIQNLRLRGVRKLVGYENLYRVRVGQYRIVYEVDDGKMLIRVTRVRHRRDAY